jgi:hypothetical protein
MAKVDFAGGINIAEEVVSSVDVTLTKYTRRIDFLLHDLLYRDRKINSIQWTEPSQVQYIATYDAVITLLNQPFYTAMGTHPTMISPGTGK